MTDKQLREAALQYHRQSPAGKTRFCQAQTGRSHILTSTATLRRIVNMSALAVAGVNKH